MIADVPPPAPAAEVILATRGMSKGIAQTDGPQVIAKGLVAFGAVQLGAQWKNVSSTTADGEAALFATASRKQGSVQLSAGISYKFQTGIHGGIDHSAFEFSVGAARKFGAVTLRSSVVYSPDDLGSARRSLFVEAGPAVQLAKGWTASAAVGRRDRQGSPDYTAFNVGIGKNIKGCQMDLRYFSTDRAELGPNYHARIVASVKVAL